MATLTMKRQFAATPDRVFAFVTRAEFLLQWWGPEGTTIADHALNFDRIGHWFAVMVSPNGEPHKVGGEVLAVTPGKCVELTLGHYAADNELTEISTLRFDVSAYEGGTQFVLTQSGLKQEYIPDMRDKGWDSALTRLAQLVNTQN